MSVGNDSNPSWPASASSALQSVLQEAIEEGCRREETELEERLKHYKELVLKIAKAGKTFLLVWAEGLGQKDSDSEREEKDLTLLERAGLVDQRMKYTKHNAYREYTLTEKGAELAEKLLEEP